ncbi:MAG: penicillin-binding protein 2 [Actinobacteria bacterium]|nr:penicillin-binding protein 2 [Actinomycetota bacterium]
MILEPAKKRRPAEDDSFLGIRVGVLMLIALMLFGVLGFRLWFLQILSGDQYVVEAKNNRVREVVVEAPRGVIYDRNGRVLVENRAGLSVGLLPMDMIDPEEDPQGFDAELSKLSVLLGMPKADLLSAYDKAKKDPYVTYTVRDDVPENPVVTYLKEHSQEFPGIEVDTSFLRRYPFKSLATHLLGYVGEVRPEDLDRPEFSSLEGGAHIGLEGVERQYDSLLRGTDGKKTVEVDAAGRPKRFLENKAPKPGNNLRLSIDADLQRAAEDAIVDGIRRAHEAGKTKAAGGAVVALDPNNGQVLALASYPEYDPSLWVGGMSVDKYAELTNPAAHQPLFDRAVNGLYPAGSTFKPFVAAAALNAGIVTKDTLFNCNGKFTVKGQTWKDWNPNPLGDVNMLQALEQSVDVYFYNLGNLFYEQPSPVLQNGVKLFGFGKPTGIDLPGETTGSRVPDKTWKAEYYQNASAEDRAWKPGDDINLAIGQGDLLVTPLQMAVGLSAIANGGTLYVPKAALSITDASGNVVHPFDPEVAGTLGMASDVLKTVRKGMRLVTEDPTGTAYKAFEGFPISVAGKTGTAQKKPDDDYALFMGYAPADGNTNPQIVVVAVIEQGGHGSSVAAPVVRQVMAAFFHTGAGTINAPQTE